jgi:hypothetical protein
LDAGFLVVDLDQQAAAVGQGELDQLGVHARPPK